MRGHNKENYPVSLTPHTDKSQVASQVYIIGKYLLLEEIRFYLKLPTTLNERNLPPPTPDESTACPL